MCRRAVPSEGSELSSLHGKERRRQEEEEEKKKKKQGCQQSTAWAIQDYKVAHPCCDHNSDKAKNCV
jgi:hypothetical protein